MGGVEDFAAIQTQVALYIPQFEANIPFPFSNRWLQLVVGCGSLQLYRHFTLEDISGDSAYETGPRRRTDS
jgi:hypothetical protein